VSALVFLHRALRTFERAAAAELGVDRCDEIAAVVMADYFGNRRRVEPEAPVLDGIDHPLNRAVL
jgi:hypothetical protein